MSELQADRSIGVYDDYAFYSIAEDVSVIQEDPLRRLFNYWNALRGTRRFPSKAEIDPTDIPWALSTIYLIDCVPPPVYWRYAIAGSEIESAFNRITLRGVVMNDIIAQPGFDIVRRRWQPARDGKSIVYMHGLIYKAADRSRTGARLVLPFSEDESNVNAVLGMSVANNPVSQPELSRLDIRTIDLEHLRSQPPVILP